MDYSELKELIKNKRLSIAYIAKLIGMTDKGLQYSLKNNKLPLDKFLELCKILEITPNEFFMNNTVQGSNNIVGVINSKVIGGMVGRCPLCAEKDKEISVLKDKIISLQEKLIEK